MAKPKKKRIERAKLTPRQRLFVQAYIIDYNAKAAALAAGYSPKTAYIQGWQQLEKQHVNDAIEEAIEQRMKRLRINADAVLYKWWQIANLDYNELSEVRSVPCDFCYGDDVREDPNAEIPEINPKCKRCRGEGNKVVLVKDTKKLSAEARTVYQGAKQGKYGVEITALSRERALENVARHLGMNKDNLDVTTNGQDIQAGLGHFYGKSDE